jgi:hypothetical protein
MGGRFSSYVTKKLPAITAFLKKGLKNNSTVPAGHIIYNVDGSPVSESQFNDIKKDILLPNEFPTALKNPDYNPEAIETKVIQKKLDAKSSQNMYEKCLDPFNEHYLFVEQKTIAKLIPDTLHDLFRYKYSDNENDEHKINQIIGNYLVQNPKNKSESDLNYYARIAEPLINFFSINFMYRNKELFKEHSEEEKEIVKKTVRDTINIELNQYAKHPNHALLYRGNGSLKDFDENDAYDIGRKGKSAQCCKAKTQSNAEMLSYGISLLSDGILGGSCPFYHAFKKKFQDKTTKTSVLEPDLQIISIPKKDFIQNKGLWFVNSKYDHHLSFHSTATRFHPRKKAITTTTNLKGQYIEGQFTQGNKRIQEFKTMNEARDKYAKAKEYHINNTIGVTPYTQSKIEAAKNAYKKGIADRTIQVKEATKKVENLSSWAGYMYSLFGYKTKNENS